MPRTYHEEYGDYGEKCDSYIWLGKKDLRDLQKRLINMGIDAEIITDWRFNMPYIYARSDNREVRLGYVAGRLNFIGDKETHKDSKLQDFFRTEYPHSTSPELALLGGAAVVCGVALAILYMLK